MFDISLHSYGDVCMHLCIFKVFKWTFHVQGAAGVRSGLRCGYIPEFSLIVTMYHGFLAMTAAETGFSHFCNMVLNEI